MTHTYDTVGRRSSSVNPIGNATGGVPADHRTDFFYDNEDRPIFVKLPAPVAGGAQLVSESRYDVAGNRAISIDANGQVTKYIYDERNRLAEVQESPSVWTDLAAVPAPLYRTTYGYDGLGSLTRITRAAGDAANERAFDMAYDGAGRQRSETQYPSWPLTSGALTTTLSYDGNGNRTSFLDPLGRTTNFAYDSVGRPTAVTYVGGGAPDVAYAYDANGNRTSMSDGTGTTSYGYDELDRVLTVTTPGPKTTAYRYDLDSNRRKLNYPDGTAITYIIDKGQRTTSLAESTRTTSYAYRADGSVQTVTFPNATTATYAYDNARRTTAVTNATSTTTLCKRDLLRPIIVLLLPVTAGQPIATAAESRVGELPTELSARRQARNAFQGRKGFEAHTCWHWDRGAFGGAVRWRCERRRVLDVVPVGDLPQLPVSDLVRRAQRRRFYIRTLRQLLRLRLLGHERQRRGPPLP